MGGQAYTSDKRSNFLFPIVLVVILVAIPDGYMHKHGDNPTINKNIDTKPADLNLPGVSQVPTCSIRAVVLVLAAGTGVVVVAVTLGRGSGFVRGL